MVRFGCLGAARIAPIALFNPVAQREDVTVTALACRSAERGREMADQYGIDAVETEYEALIARDDVDAIYNALPPSRHADLTIKALRAGKPVLCEKPFAMNADEAARMVAVSEETGVFLMEAFHYRFHPAFIQAFDIVKGGDLGRIKSAAAGFNVEVPYLDGELRHELALGGGALMDLGCYPVHWLRTLLDGAPDVACATTVTGREGIDLSMKAELIFDGGVPGKVQTSMAPGVDLAADLRVVGGNAVLKMRNPLAPQRGYKIEIMPEGAEEPILVAAEDEGGRSTYDHQLDHFLACLNGDATPLVTLQDSVANMRVIDEIYTTAGMKPRGI